MKRFHAITLFLLGCLIYAAPTQAATLTLSELSSDSTDPALLDATLDFQVVDSLLTLTVTNNTASPDDYNINAIYFNSTSDVESLSLSSISGWSLLTDATADGFGVFDYALTANKESQISAGDTQTFELTIIPTSGADVTDQDFVTESSTIPPGSQPTLAAAKFVRGPDDDSAFGAIPGEPSPAPVIPLPSSTLMGLSLLSFFGLMRRWRG